MVSLQSVVVSCAAQSQPLAYWARILATAMHEVVPHVLPIIPPRTSETAS